MTHPSNTSVTAQFGAGERGEPFTPRDAWDELVHKDDRTSPEDYPDMCLITFEELRDFMDRAAPVSHTSVKDGGSEALREIDRRLEDLAEANAIYGKDLRLNAPDKIARNDREISWLKDLRSVIAHPGSGDAEPGAEDKQ